MFSLLYAMRNRTAVLYLKYIDDISIVAQITALILILLEICEKENI